jgi:flagellar basal body-associated protein FliL
MAASVSFKQECKSCGAQVPIRDAGLVGRKIDCPKCKYSFVVEKPTTEEGIKEEEKAPAKSEKAPAKKESDSKVTNAKPATVKAANGKAPSKTSPAAKNGKPAAKKPKGEAAAKKGGRSMTLILGIGLGLVAVVGLVVGAVIFFSSGSKSGGGSKGGAATSGANAPAPPGTNPQAGNTATEAAKDKDKDKEKDPKPAASSSSAVADVSNLLPNETETVVSLNIPLLLRSSINKAALHTPGTFQDANFRKSFGFSIQDVERVILAYQAQPHNGVFSVMRTSKPVPHDQLVANLRLEGPTEVNGLKLYLVRKHLDGLSNFLVKGNLAQEACYLHIVDERTLVFAGKPVMDKFLSDKARPKFLTDAATTAPPSDKAQPAPRTSNPSKKMSFNKPPPRRDVFEDKSAVEVLEQESEYQFVSYQAVQPVRPRTSGDGRPMPMGPNGRMQPGTNPGPNANQPPPPAVTTSYMTVQPVLKNVLDKAENAEKPALVVVATLASSKLAKEIGQRFLDTIPSGGIGEQSDKDLKLKVLPFLGVQALALNLTALYESKLTGTLALEGRDEQSKTKLEEAVRFFGDDFPTSSIFSTYIKDTLGLEVTGLTPQQPNNAQTSPLGFERQRPMPPPMGQPPAEAAAGRDGALNLYKYDGVLVLNLEMTLKEPAYNYIMEKVKEFFIQLKGYAELANPGSRVHELAAALQAYVKDKGAFPRGTVERKAEGERRLGYAPQTRLSWMVELLPYLDEGNYRDVRLNSQAAWWDNANFLAAQMIVPQFLARTRAEQPARIRYGSIATHVGATNFVGVAGLGFDAANYRADDPSVKNKLGVFGYDRVTKVSDVKGGLDKTIALLQVPMQHPTPWIAGGGATVRGVSDDKLDASAIAPFVCAQYEGKEGTFAIMGDGKVRFIPKTIGNDVFRALCTINGPKQIGSLDAIAPEVPPPEGVSELKAQPLQESVKPTPTPEPTPPTTPVTTDKKDWKELVSTEGRFSVLVPAKIMKAEITNQNEPFGPMDVTQQKAFDPEAKTGYVIAYGDLPANEAAKGPDMVFPKLRDQLMKQLELKGNGKETKVALGTVPGIEYGVEATGDKTSGGLKQETGVIRIYLAKNRIYVLMIASDNGPLTDQKGAKKFFDSFKITDAASKPSP